MKNFLFIKKSRRYRQSLYFLVIGVMIFQLLLFVLNLALIEPDSNLGLVFFNMVFLVSVTYLLYRYILPKYRYKIATADYHWFKIVDGILSVKYDNEIKQYNFSKEGDFVKEIKFVLHSTTTVDSVTRLSYNVNIKLSDGHSVIALLSYAKAQEFVQAIPNAKLVERLNSQLSSDEEYYISRVSNKGKKIPSIICFCLGGITLLYALLIVFGYSTTTGTYYATELMKTNPRAPINSYTYEVDRVNYKSREDYTISFGDNLNEDITVFYNKDNPEDSYTMYTVDFLGFITITLVIIGGILLNNKYSHYMAVLGLSIVPFYLIKLLNISISSLFTTHIMIPVLSLLSIPIYLFLSGVLKFGTDIIKNRKELINN